MLSSLALYMLFVAAGIFAGARILSPDRKYAWIGRIQTAALLLLIFTMGVTIGADRRVLSSVGTLGAQAFVISVAAVAGSVLFVYAGRRLMRLDRRGVRTDAPENAARSERADGSAFAGRSERACGSVYAGRSEHADGSAYAGRSERACGSEHADRSAFAGRSEYTDGGEDR